MGGLINLILQFIPCIVVGRFLSKINPNIANKFATILINFGVPISLVGLLLKTGINIKLIYAALISSSSISNSKLTFLILFL